MNRTIRTRPASRWLALSVFTLALALGGLLFPACSAQANDQAAGDKEVVAKVNGEEITQADLEEQASQQLTQVDAQLEACQADAERNRFQILETAMKEAVEEKLIEAEAAKRGISKEELVAAEIDAEVQPVTDADVDAWYTENQGRLQNRPKEEIAPQIKQFLGQQRQQEARSGFLASLREGAKVAYYLEPPRTEVAAVGPAKGPADAPVTIVEFSDFECPFCSRVNPTLDQVQETYGDKVRIVFRQFPLRIHPNAPKAAEASLCAHEQGKFWQMHDLLFEEQRQLTVPDLKSKAARLELDTEAFNQCLDSGEFADEVQADLQAGTQAGVSGTPAMFVNGRLVSGAVPFETLAEVIDMELARAGGESDGK